MLRFSLSWQLSPTQPLPALQCHRGENGKVEVRKLMGCKQSKTWNTFTTAHGSALCRAPSSATLTWENKHHHCQHPHFLLLLLCAVVWCGKSLWSVGISCPSCDPSQPLVHPQSLTGEKERPLLCASPAQQELKHPSVIHSFQQKSET